MNTGRLIATTVYTISENLAVDGNAEEAEKVEETEENIQTEGSDDTSSAAVGLNVLNTSIGLKRRQSDSVDSIQEYAVNGVKRRKQEYNELLDKSASENGRDKNIAEQHEINGQTKYIALKDGSDKDGQTEDFALKYCTENDAETEDTAPNHCSENDAESEDIALKEGFENDGRTGSLENDGETEDTALTDVSENDGHTEDIGLQDGSNKGGQTEDITLTDGLKNDEQTEDMVAKDYFKEGGQTEDITVKDCSKNDGQAKNSALTDLSKNDGQVKNVAPKDDSQYEGKTEDIVLIDGSENVNTTGKAQELLGKDESAWVIEDDFIQSEDELPSRDRMPYTNNFQRFNNRWYWVSIKRYPGAEPEGSSNEHTIYVYNTDTYVKEDCILKEFKTSLRGKDVFYHGTTAESAKSIIEQGIDLTESTRHVDFSAGKGFYVTDDYEKACQWSERKQRFHCRKPAVVVFKIDSNLRQNETHLLLKVDNDTNRKFWECIVSHFRHGKRSPVITRILEDVKYIEGPVAHNRRLGQQEIPTPKDSGKFQQLCICNQGYARKFGSLENILCVIFIVD